MRLHKTAAACPLCVKVMLILLLPLGSTSSCMYLPFISWRPPSVIDTSFPAGQPCRDTAESQAASEQKGTLIGVGAVGTLEHAES